jgi:hypothetical protein
LRRALEVMKSKKAMKAAMESVENDYFANSSRVARSAKRHAVHSIWGQPMNQPCHSLRKSCKPWRAH